jgi:hypothetical protein
MMHGYLLSQPGVRFVGHSHPVAINAITCSVRGEELACGGRMMAEEVVFCGPASCWVPYTDPGIGLARAVRTAVETFQGADAGGSADLDADGSEIGADFGGDDGLWGAAVFAGVRHGPAHHAAG